MKAMQDESLREAQRKRDVPMNLTEQQQFLDRDAPRLWLAHEMKVRYVNPEAAASTLLEIEEETHSATDAERWNVHIRYFNGIIRMLLFIFSFARKHPKKGYIFLDPYAEYGVPPTALDLGKLHAFRMYAERNGLIS